MKPKISVCMPTYNQEGYIAQAIEGVLMQKGCDYELIIADDGSTDGTAAICRDYQHRHPDIIKIISQTSNKGVVLNTKDCLEAAEGQYIAICEGDDWWIDECKLTRQAAILDTEPDVSMVHTNWINYLQESKTFKERNFKPKSSYLCETARGGIA